MIIVENIEVWGFEHAVRGMRNPLASHHLSDSQFDKDHINIGPKDLDLMQRLYNAGSEHRKYLRQIVVSMDITAPLYWWKEFDTYKVGTVANSYSTMHKIQAKEFTPEDFSIEHLYDFESHQFAAVSINGERCLYSSKKFVLMLCEMLNYYRKQYLESKNKDDWWQMIQLLPSSYNQKRTITMNYENVMTIIKQRSGHKLDEWNDFIEILKNELPYIDEIRGKKLDAE